MTLKEIAKEAGVAISTVSRVLNQKDSSAASAEVRERIVRIAAASGYVPNAHARVLRSGTDEGRGCRYAHILIACHQGEVKDDPFFTIVAENVEKELARQGIIVAATHAIADLEKPGFWEHFHRSTPSGLIIIGRFQPSLLTEVRQFFKHIVYVGLNRLDVDCDQVLCDAYEGTRAAVRYLADLGHQRIGFLGADREARCKGFLRESEALHLVNAEQRLVLTGLLSFDDGYNGFRQLLQIAPDVTAVVCANDLVAIGVLRACQDLGLKVPDDLSVIGMVDIPNTRYVNPQLTTIHVPMEEMGRLGAKLLAEHAAEEIDMPLRVHVPFRLVERESCRQIKSP